MLCYSCDGCCVTAATDVLHLCYTVTTGVVAGDTVMTRCVTGQ